MNQDTAVILHKLFNDKSHGSFGCSAVLFPSISVPVKVIGGF